MLKGEKAVTIRNRFHKENDSIINVRCATKEISGEGTSMSIDLSSLKIIEVSTDRHYWPNKIYAWARPKSVKIVELSHCEYFPEENIVKPIRDTTFFTLQLEGMNSLQDPDTTVTVGEDPPNDGEG